MKQTKQIQLFHENYNVIHLPAPPHPGDREDRPKRIDETLYIAAHAKQQTQF